MQARWYLPGMGRFASADTIVPDPQNPQSYNRYSYVLNRVLNFTDPTGHKPTDGCEVEGCMADQGTWGQNFVNYMAQKNDRTSQAVNALYDQYYNDYAAVIDYDQISSGSNIEYTIWKMAYDDTMALDHSIEQGGWLTNAIKEAFGGGYLDPFDIITGSVGAILATTVGSDSADDEYGPAGFGPADIQPTLDRINSGGTYPHRNDGTTFNNREGLLPSQPKGYYTEYVHPTSGVSGPGLQRIVTGQGGEIYFTPDHYKRFIRIR